MLKLKSMRSLILLCFVLSFISCNTMETKSEIAVVEDVAETPKSKFSVNKDFRDYWYAGEAEITSYKLEQERYGELRDGTAVLVYVTEDFLPDVQVKADNNNTSNVSVLKLNATKKFNTGIYPYSIMQSTFYPVSNNQHALKITCSVQEWCGQVYAQLNNRSKFEIMSHSYFEGEADRSYSLTKTWTENELWTKLRIDPKSMPTGELSIIPSFEFTRLKHKTIEAYNAIASLDTNTYTITYPALNRTLKINFQESFPYEILGWEETTLIGYGSSPSTMTTKAIKLETLKTAYWQKNSNADSNLREKLKLD
ncbi:MAG: septum formation inhibitor Maf [Winogradskyella sp.]|nr:septum formation inhibitor Maf [Winogradskyella sp.]